MERIEIIGQGKFLQLINRNGWEFVQRKNVSAIVAIVAEYQGQAVFVEQMRPAVGKRCLEWPAGLVGDIPGQENEDMLTAAQRELEEETGFRAQSLELLTFGPASAGESDEIIHFFRARDLTRVAAGGGVDDENITVHLVPLEQVHAWLKERQSQGVYIDLKVYTGLYFLQAHA